MDVDEEEEEVFVPGRRKRKAVKYVQSDSESDASPIRPGRKPRKSLRADSSDDDDEDEFVPPADDVAMGELRDRDLN
jgi:hypothetical protein